MTGFNMPPGCSPRDIPGWDDDGQCEVCFNSVDLCICPECPVCREQGSMACYHEQHMRPTRGIILSRSRERIRRTEDMLRQCRDMLTELAGSEDWNPEEFDITKDGLS